VSLIRTTSLAVGALALAAVSLTGCSAISDQAHHRLTSHADTRADLASPPEWMPSDATDITSVSGTAGKESDSAPQTVVFTSSAGVTSDGCTTVPRSSAPTIDVDGAPDAYKTDSVLRCGSWSLSSKKHRWIAWTPNTGDGVS
jgi:hypothetical protein